MESIKNGVKFIIGCYAGLVMIGIAFDAVEKINGIVASDYESKKKPAEAIEATSDAKTVEA